MFDVFFSSLSPFSLFDCLHQRILLSPPPEPSIGNPFRPSYFQDLAKATIHKDLELVFYLLGVFPCLLAI